jgi:hypothetical protein
MAEYPKPTGKSNAVAFQEPKSKDGARTKRAGAYPYPYYPYPYPYRYPYPRARAVRRSARSKIIPRAVRSR